MDANEAQRTAPFDTVGYDRTSMAPDDGAIPEDAEVTVLADGLRLRYAVGRSGIMSKLTRRGARGAKSYLALRGVSLATRKGEFVGIVGRNGSGKSSLLRVLAGVEPPTQGLVMTSAKPQLLGVSAALLPDVSGEENIRLGLLAMGFAPSEIPERAEAVRALADIGEAVELPMRTYSSGMGARLRFAISVAAEPEILMIDEALSTGDAAFKERSKRAMDGLIERAGTVFLVSHAAQTIEEMCTRAVWLDAGRVVCDGPAEEVARAYRWYAHNLAEGNAEKAAGLLAEATQSLDERQRNLLFPRGPVSIPEPSE